MKRSLWMGAAIMAAFGIVRMMRQGTGRRKWNSRIGIGKRMLRNIRMTGMMNIPSRYMAGFGSRMLRRMAR
ncbi:hypothetical protein AM501_25025 [Aneurinibacillus migulanus]|uniref:Uncharacterized protein n=1 Tax=Aneurinibacillus migulanus TaxID=47500 RepID=A0A0D1V3Q9_ANEMI|nr:hypothetical protein [Aneurinibacillus migulanus]KIV52872.1 hypothetical protein TS65_22435 [Aneurinibacillus migulanus]KIV53999.1 hypothetical protein TS64_16980 [Aneurinibacillus migulanus]KON95147.1 hypothetical protein AF333_06275 [Aneurinibacillus migulanus]KPD05661.1 hypothetical protein AM501_25025 [Aneurinibacillus migulanus]MCP1355383.1 hypothetical protein [Aneurinibacillus migulanus]